VQRWLASRTYSDAGFFTFGGRFRHKSVAFSTPSEKDEAANAFGSQSKLRPAAENDSAAQPTTVVT
jgi:hypothetical protein